MILGNDIARCMGTGAPLCSTCARHNSPAGSPFQWYTSPVIDDEGIECANHIEDDYEEDLDPYDQYRDLVDSATKAFMSENYND